MTLAVIIALIVAGATVIGLVLGYISHAHVPKLFGGKKDGFIRRLFEGNTERTLAETGADIIAMFQAGLEEARTEIDKMQHRIDELTNEVTRLRAENAQLLEMVTHAAKIDQLITTIHVHHADQNEAFNKLFEHAGMDRPVWRQGSIANP